MIVPDALALVDVVPWLDRPVKPWLLDAPYVVLVQDLDVTLVTTDGCLARPALPGVSHPGR